MDLEKTVDAVNEVSCEGTDLNVSSDYPAQSVRSSCKKVSRGDRSEIYSDVSPGSGSSETVLRSMDSNSQRAEDPGRSATVGTNPFSYRPCDEVHTLRTDSATTAADAVNEVSCEGTELVSSDNPAQSVSSACKTISRVNKRDIHLDVFPGSGSSEPLIMYPYGQRRRPRYRCGGRDKFLLLQAML